MSIPPFQFCRADTGRSLLVLFVQSGSSEDAGYAATVPLPAVVSKGHRPGAVSQWRRVPRGRTGKGVPVSSSGKARPPPGSYSLLLMRTARTIARATASAAAAPSASRLLTASPVLRAKTMSPSKIVCAGEITRVRPPCARCARRLASAFDSAALVATTTRVVLVGARTKASSPSSSSSTRAVSTNSPDGDRAPAMMVPVCASRTSPKAFTTASAPTTTPPARGTAVVPIPPRIAPAPSRWPTVAPVPAPTNPAGVNPDPAFFEVAHHPVGRRQAEGAAAGQQDGMGAFDEHPRPEQVGLLGGRRTAADVHAGNRALGAEHDRAAGLCVHIGGVADANPRDGGDAAMRGHGRPPPRRTVTSPPTTRVGG